MRTNVYFNTYFISCISIKCYRLVTTIYTLWANAFVGGGVVVAAVVTVIYAFIHKTFFILNSFIAENY